jgi:ubiquinone/menaquinone biosynthesis C-methylase UbiE
VVALDLSPAMAALTAGRLPNGFTVIGDALRLPFAGGSVERVFAGHFYGHLPPEERRTFLAEAARVAHELIVVDTAFREDTEPEQWQERTLNDGSRHRVFKRYLAADQLADEIGGEAALTGRWFVAARADLHLDQDLGRSPRIRAT